MISTKSRSGPRQRVSRACLLCRSSKRKCTGSSPCDHCLKRGRAADCRYPGEHRSATTTEHASPATVLVPRILQVERPSGVHQSPNPQAAGELADGTDEQMTQILETLSPDNISFVPPRVLENAQKTKVFVGSTAIISFLPLLRSCFRWRIGPTEFTELTDDGQMLETEFPPRAQHTGGDLLSLSQKTELVATFFTATSGILDIVDASHIHAILANQNRGHHIDASSTAISSLVICIGARCHPDSTSFRRAEHAYFEHSRQFLTLEALTTVRLETVVILMLATFYVSCTCQRNLSYIYAGIATRAAHVLGLHSTTSSTSFPAAENAERLRIWKSLRVLETLISSLLGRPIATMQTSRSSEEIPLSSSQMQPSRALPVEASYRLLAVTDPIMEDIRHQKIVDAKTARASLDCLNTWSSSLPSCLRTASQDNSTDVSHRDQVLGNLHVACAYYFSVILVTRPFLVHFLLGKDQHGHKLSSSNPAQAPDSVDVDIIPEIELLAKTCEDAAVFLVHDCQDVMEKDLLLDNMTFLQAYVLGAALIIALTSVFGKETDSGVGASFNAAINVMRKLSSGSAQAARYYGILSSLQRDMDAWQNRRAREKRRAALRPVTDLLQPLDRSPDIATGDVGCNQHNLDALEIDWEQAFIAGDDLWSTALPQDLPLAWPQMRGN